MSERYAPPELVDYGSLTDLTAAVQVSGAEDGASKLVVQHHSAPAAP